MKTEFIFQDKATILAFQFRFRLFSFKRPSVERSCESNLLMSFLKFMKKKSELFNTDVFINKVTTQNESSSNSFNSFFNKQYANK